MLPLSISNVARTISIRSSYSSQICQKVFQSPKFGLPICAIRWKGHSHWDNIKLNKMECDREKSAAITKLTKQVWGALKADGGPDPKKNKRLEEIMFEASRLKISPTILQKIIDKSISKPSQIHFIPIKGPGEARIIVTAYATSRNYVVGQMKYRAKKVSLHFEIDVPSVKEYFTHVGVVCLLKDSSRPEVEVKEQKKEKGWTAAGAPIIKIPKPLTLDDAETLAIELNAESVSEIKDDEGKDAFEILCDHTHIPRIEKELSNRNYIVYKAEEEFRPYVYVKLNTDHMKLIDQFYDQLESHELAEMIYDNLELEN